MLSTNGAHIYKTCRLSHINVFGVMVFFGQGLDFSFKLMQSRHKRGIEIAVAIFLLCLVVIVLDTWLEDKTETLESPAPLTELTINQNSLYLEYFLSDISRKHDSGDVYSFSNKLRLYKQLRSVRGTSLLPNDFERAFHQLHDHLFSWALKRHRSVEELQRSFSGRGIVVCAGGKYVRLAVHAIKVIRLLGCNLPVEVFYNGPDDMNPKQREYLMKMRRVNVVNIQDYIDSKALGLETWDIKPFSLLLSSFAEAILIDADTIFVQSPQTLYDDPGYVNTGTAFFYDRTLFGYISGNATAWFDSIVPAPLSQSLLSSRIYNRTTNYEQEAGVVLVDKSRRLLGMLATCRLNFPDFKKDLHKFTHGDKESFWLGMELAGEPYYFIPSMAGSVGNFKENADGSKEICGKAAHFDRHEKLFWFNDGFVENKHAVESDPSHLQFYGIEGKWKVLCLQCDPKPLEASTKMSIHRMLGNFERDPLEMGDPRDGAAMFLLGKT